jgi:hypothetical protein
LSFNPFIAVAAWFLLHYSVGMNWLTPQEKLIICLVLGLLVTGLSVKYYRAAHLQTTSSQPVKP